MAAKGIDRQLSIEDLVSDIDTYFRAARATEYQRKKNDIIGKSICYANTFIYSYYLILTLMMPLNRLIISANNHLVF